MREKCKNNVSESTAALRIQQGINQELTKMKQYFKDLDRYADVLTKEQMRVVCHISKRKAAYLLQAGLIPCINTGKKTHTYLIGKADVANYLWDRDVNPDRYRTPPAISVLGEKQNTAANSSSLDRLIPPDILKAYYVGKLLHYPDLLTVVQVKLITGYGENTVHGWINKGKLSYIECISGWRIPKIYLIEFLCSPYCNNISRKTQKHLVYLSEIH